MAQNEFIELQKQPLYFPTVKKLFISLNYESINKGPTFILMVKLNFGILVKSQFIHFHEWHNIIIQFLNYIHLQNTDLVLSFSREIVHSTEL